MKSTIRRSFGWLVVCLLGGTGFLGAQEPADLLGNAGLLANPNAVALLGLDDEQQAQLEAWREARLEKAAELLKSTDGSTAEGQATLIEFVDASEGEVEAVLRTEQRDLMMVALRAQGGLPSLDSAEISKALKLTAEQLDDVKTLLAKRQADYEQDPDASLAALNSKYELLIKRVMTPSQLAAWRVLSLEVPGELPEISPPMSETEVVDVGVAEATPEVVEEETKITFSFGQMDWEKLIEWFAEQAELSLQLETTLPDGTFSYKDKREYTVAESIDLLNNVLMLKGVTLVRNDRQLLVVDLEEIPEQLIPTIAPAELSKRGKYEIVNCVFALQFARAEDLQPEIRDLVNEDYGNAAAIQLANQLVIRETVGNLRAISDIVDDAEERARAQKQPVESLGLNYITTDEAMVLVRSLFSIEEDSFTDEDGTIWIAPDSLGLRLFYRGDEDRVEQLMQLIKVADKEPDAVEREEDPFSLHTYSVRANPEMVLKVLQTLLANLHPDIRVEVAPETRAVVLWGRESDHQKALTTIEQLQGNAVDFGVVDLRDYDPDEVTQMLVDAGMIADPLIDDESTSYLAKVVVDPLRQRLVIRGTKSQVDEITRFIEGVDPPRDTSGLSRSTARLIPLTGDEADQAMRRIETLWPTTQRGNRLQFKVIGDDKPRLRERGTPSTAPATPAVQPNGNDTADDPVGEPAADPSASKVRSADAWQYVTFQVPARPATTVAQEGSVQIPGSDIVIEKTPYGLIIRSDDVDALDDLEDLIRDTMALESTVPIPTVFYLLNRPAQEAQDLLSEMLGLSTSSSGGGGGGLGMLGGLAGNMIGGPAGDIVGSMLGGGAGGGSASSGMYLETTGDVGMVADPKLNALIVQANDEDLGLIEELLEFIDQDEPPVPPELEGKTRVIPVRYQDATQVATIVREQLGDFIKGSSPAGGGGQNQQAQAQQQILQAILGQRGGRGGRGGGGGGGAQIEPIKIAVSVETNTNSLVVTGPVYLQDKVAEIVEQLDRPEIAEKQNIDIIKLKGNINPELLREGLQAAFEAESSTSSNRPGTPGARTPGGATGGATDAARREAIQRFFQQQGGGGGAAFGGRGGGGRGGAPGGGGRGGGGGGRGGR